jgi:hypothetical protein
MYHMIMDSACNVTARVSSEHFFEQMIDNTHHKQIVAHVCVDVPSDGSAV